MNPQELRIGNLLNPSDLIIENHIEWQQGKASIVRPIPEFLTVKSIDKNDGVTVEEYFPYCALTAFQRIPLTLEWLERFGFEFDHETKSWSILTSLEKFDYCFEISNKYQEFYQPDFLAIDIKHVHQLQNLYHALTGEELILKAEK